MIQMLNQFRIYHVLIIIVLIALSIFGLSLLFNFVILTPLLGAEFYIILAIFFILVISTAVIHKTSSQKLIYQKIGFLRCQSNYWGVVLAGVSIIWLADYFLQVYAFNIVMIDEASQWYKNSPRMLNVFISSVILAPIVEEMLFRGVLLQTLSNYLSKFWVAIIVSALFALVHFDGLQALSLFSASLFFVWLTFKYNSIFPAIFAHVLNNLITFGYYIYLTN